MASLTSSSFSGPSSPAFSVIADRTQIQGPRSPRGYNQKTSHLTSEDKSKVRQLRLGQSPCTSHERGTLAPCRVSPRTGRVSTAGPSGRKSRSPRAKVRSNISADDSGSPTSASPSRETPVTSKFSPHAGFQAHHGHHESSAAEHTNRRLFCGQQIQVARSSPGSPALSPLALPLHSQSHTSLASPSPRVPSRQRRSLHGASTTEPPPVRFPTSGPSTPPFRARPLSSR